MATQTTRAAKPKRAAATPPQNGGTTAKAALAAKTGPVSLADLSDEDRERLIQEAAQAAAALQAAKAASVAAEPETAAALRTTAIRALLEDRDHLKGCPADGRVEAYADTRPANPQAALPERPVTVVRCMECGGAQVIEEPYAAIMATIDAALTDQ